MADTRYLQRRGRIWYVRVPNPPWEPDPPGNKRKPEFTYSLKTSDLAKAQGMRDRYVLPLLRACRERELVSTIAALAASADADVARRLREAEITIAGEGEALTLREAADLFMDHMKRSSDAYAPATLRKYEGVFDGACKLLGDDADLERLTKQDAAALRDRLQELPSAWRKMNGPPRKARKEQKRMASATVRRYLAQMRSLIDWLLAEGKLSRGDNPFDGINVARVTTKHKRAPDADEAEALMHLSCPRKIETLTWEAMPMLARYTGARASEIGRLRAEDVVEREGIRCLQITKRGGRRLKTPSSERIIPVADKLVDVVDRLLAERPEGRLLRPADWEHKVAHQFLKHWNRRAKKVAADLSFHCWRTYFNDALATAGVDILDRERLLGHKSDRTQAAYTPENLTRLQAAVNKVK